ncbi:uncharacterized protein QC763_0031090 [Podospora pseudopauciseta]|uniref:Uncharacterized protein n=1 Tax=Podospora pseudopauciseta TaxID=2093780 RepID=A0ABR0HMY5_9PEZI|nr:hypothetical protein QC763_0031090 [Podospora pseudopauciseta]
MDPGPPPLNGDLNGRLVRNVEPQGYSADFVSFTAHVGRDHDTVKTFSNLLNSVHHPYAGARCSASPGSSADYISTR